MATPLLAHVRDPHSKVKKKEKRNSKVHKTSDALVRIGQRALVRIG
jgi:hypothetical protein